jgi:hypothetical protein
MVPTNPIESMTDRFRELDRRSNDRIDVRLLWRERDDRVIVAVADGKTGERFSVEVSAGERVLDVFHHPFAYAAWRGIDTRAETPELSPATLRLSARTSS